MSRLSPEERELFRLAAEICQGDQSIKENAILIKRYKRLSAENKGEIPKLRLVEEIK